MKKGTEPTSDEVMKPEYDFTGAKPGSAYRPAMQNGYTIREEPTDGTVTITHVPPENAIVLEPDVQAYFPDSESVNHALRTIITLFPKPEKKARKTSQTGAAALRRAAKAAQGGEPK